MSCSLVGDSAMYEKCTERAGSMLWLSRVPHVLKQAKQVLCYSREELAFTSLEKGYEVSKSLHVTYKGNLQRWVVVYSEQKHKKEIETLNKKLSQEAEKFSKQLWHLSNQVYACKKDAHQGLKSLSKSLVYHEISFSIDPVKKHGKVGRPKAAASKELVGYKVKGSLVVNKEVIAKKEKESGKFILATNQMDVTSLGEATMLDEYKQQMHTERGFRFIKADAFEVSSIFLKKPSRIEALMMVMTLCLMTYNLSEHFLHQELDRKREYISNQLNKPVQRPSMVYVYRLFEGIQVLKINFGTYLQEIVTNLVEELRKIINCFGPLASEIYDITA